MAVTSLLSRFVYRHTPKAGVAFVSDVAPAEPPTQQEVLDQLDADVVRQFQRMLELDNSFA